MFQVGENLKKLEDMTIDILQDLADDLAVYKNEPVDLREQFHGAVAMITFSLVRFFLRNLRLSLEI